MSYNGWSNYETWRTNLELLQGLDALDEFLHNHKTIIADNRDEAVNRVASWLCEMAYEVVEAQSSGWASDLATVFLSHVNWFELATHHVDDYVAENA